jgi:hypothetical protein
MLLIGSIVLTDAGKEKDQEMGYFSSIEHIYSDYSILQIRYGLGPRFGSKL